MNTPEPRKRASRRLTGLITIRGAESAAAEAPQTWKSGPELWIYWLISGTASGAAQGMCVMYDGTGNARLPAPH